MQDVLFEAVVLHVARVVDPPKSAGKENLSLQAVVELEKDPAIHKLVDDAIAKSEIAQNGATGCSPIVTASTP